MDTREMLMKLEETAALLIAAAVQLRQSRDAHEQELGLALYHALLALDAIEAATDDELRELIEGESAERREIEADLDAQRHTSS